MNDLAYATGIGAISGARSMLGPALVFNRLSPVQRFSLGRLASAAASPGARRLLAALAVAELIADKSRRLPPRIETMPLMGRIGSGAFAAASHAASGGRTRAAVAGAAGAVAATFALYYLRRAISRRLSDRAVALGEDALAVGLGLLMVRQRDRSTAPGGGEPRRPLRT